MRFLNFLMSEILRNFMRRSNRIEWNQIMRVLSKTIQEVASIFIYEHCELKSLESLPSTKSFMVWNGISSNRKISLVLVYHGVKINHKCINTS